MLIEFTNGALQLSELAKCDMNMQLAGSRVKIAALKFRYLKVWHSEVVETRKFSMEPSKLL